MRRVKRLKEAIARLERDSVATEAQLEEEFEHGYAAGFNAGRAEMDKKLRDLIADIVLAAAWPGTDWKYLPAYIGGLHDAARGDIADLRAEIARLKTAALPSEWHGPRAYDAAEIQMMDDHVAETQRRRDAGEPA